MNYQWKFVTLMNNFSKHGKHLSMSITLSTLSWFCILTAKVLTVQILAAMLSRCNPFILSIKKTLCNFTNADKYVIYVNREMHSYLNNGGAKHRSGFAFPRIRLHKVYMCLQYFIRSLFQMRSWRVWQSTGGAVLFRHIQTRGCLFKWTLLHSHRHSNMSLKGIQREHDEIVTPHHLCAYLFLNSTQFGSWTIAHNNQIQC
jgi:hypothetical protein